MLENKRNDLIALKMANYFVTKHNYKPIIVKNTKNDIWLENFHEYFKIIRIVISPILSQNQLMSDIDICKRVKKSIEKTTFSLKTRMLNIYVNCEEEFPYKEKYLQNIIVMNNLDLNKEGINYFNDIKEYVDFNVIDYSEFEKLSMEINVHTAKRFGELRKIMEKKSKPYATYTLIIINVLVFLMLYVFGRGSEDVYTLLFFGAHYKPLIIEGEYYRLITSTFLHGGITHLLFNNYALFLLGHSVEKYLGTIKFIIIYFLSSLLGSLFTLIIFPDTISVGASGAIYGLFGAILYFGYNNRTIFGSMLKNNLVPIVAVNLVLSFVLPGINYISHIGGLIAGVLVTMALGTLNSDPRLRIHGILSTLILFAGTIYMAFFI